MGFVKYKNKATEYQGESFTKTLTKEDGSIWEANEIGYFSMTDVNALEVSTGSLSKSGDNLGLTFTVSKDDTGSLEGKYLLLIHLNDSIDVNFDDVIAEYEMTYINKKAIKD